MENRVNENYKIHPLIDLIDVSDEVKLYFTKLEFYEIIEDKIEFSTPSQEIDECRKNQWSFGVDLEHCNAEDIALFYKSVISGRRKYLSDNNIHTKMIFYTWYDPMSGNFYFSLIPENWSKLPSGQELPFGCTVNKVNDLEDIISNFINDPYKGIIPMDELVEVSEDDDEEDDPKKYILDVWSIIL